VWRSARAPENSSELSGGWLLALVGDRKWSLAVLRSLQKGNS
jgi:hypothetical protein